MNLKRERNIKKIKKEQDGPTLDNLILIFLSGPMIKSLH